MNSGPVVGGRPDVMASARHPTRKQREGFDIGLLAAAAIAAVAAALLTSKLWPGGTLVSTALTPVIVALVKEWLRKPAERISAVSAKAPHVAARVVSPPRGNRRPGESQPTEPQGAPAGRLDDRLPAENRGIEESVLPSVSAPEGEKFVVPPQGTFVEPASGVPSGYRLYRRGRLHWRLALVTGVLAFAGGALVLTAAELVLGGAVATKSSTTVFGGGAQGSSQSKGHPRTNSGGERSGDQGAKHPPAQRSVKPSSKSSTQPKRTTLTAPSTSNQSPSSPSSPSPPAPQGSPTTPPSQPPSKPGSGPSP